MPSSRRLRRLSLLGGTAAAALAFAATSAAADTRCAGLKGLSDARRSIVSAEVVAPKAIVDARTSRPAPISASAN